MNDLISILVPCYNAERFLEPCLDSLLRQDYGNFEIVCVDDGSTDSTLRILTAYAEQSQRIRIIVQKHGSLVVARQTSVEHARGEWAIFCDADDMLAPCALSVLAAAAAPGVDFVRGGFTRSEADLPATAADCPGELPVMLSGGAFLKRELVVVGHRTVWGAIFRRTILLAQIWEPSLRWTDDFAVNIQAFLAARSCIELQAPLYFYRENPHSITQAGRLDVFLRWRGSLYLVESILQEKASSPPCAANGSIA